MRTFKDLLVGLDAIRGVPFQELAPAVGVELNRRHKDLAGNVVSSALGVARNPRPTPDIEDLGTEIKTVPVDGDLRPYEPTKITMIDYVEVARNDWASSRLQRKLRTTLFVAVVKYDRQEPSAWFVRDGFLWLPSLDQARQLEEDYEEARFQIANGYVDELSSASPPSGTGRFLMAKTSGRDARDRTSFAIEGRRYEAKRRAWFLRKPFTGTLLRDNLAVDSRLDVPVDPETPTLFG